MKPTLYFLAATILTAATILGTAWALRDSPHKDTATFLIIALWWIPFSTFVLKPAKHSKCCKSPAKNS